EAAEVDDRGVGVVAERDLDRVGPGRVERDLRVAIGGLVVEVEPQPPDDGRHGHDRTGVGQRRRWARRSRWRCSTVLVTRRIASRYDARAAATSPVRSRRNARTLWRRW